VLGFFQISNNLFFVNYLIDDFFENYDVFKWVVLELLKLQYVLRIIIIVPDSRFKYDLEHLMIWKLL